MKRPPRKTRLTELAVRKLQPEPVTYQVWDAHQHGLALRVQPTGRKSWYAVYSRHGRPRWLRIGDAQAIGLADARQLTAETMLEVARGKDPAAERKAERGSGTFGDLATQYVEQHSKKHNKSWQQADRLVRRYLLPAWDKLQATGITRGDSKALLARIEAPALANQVKASGSALYSWAVREEIVASNPFRGIDANPIHSRERVLAASELPLVWRAFDDAGLVAASALKTILLTGQRPCEVTCMRREHIVDNWWTLPGAPDAALGWPGTKNGGSHRVWLPTAVQKIIAELGDDRDDNVNSKPTGFVFGVARLDGAMRNICAKLGIAKATPHDLRRTHGTTIAALGFGRDAMNRIQNHKEGGIGLGL
jgi:integrase